MKEVDWNEKTTRSFLHKKFIKKYIIAVYVLIWLYCWKLEFR